MTPPPAMMPASMERPTFNALLQGLPVLGRTGDGSVRVTTIVTDSRRVIPGALFFALPGRRADGHAFLDDAIARGAAAIVTGNYPSDWVTPSLLKALSGLTTVVAIDTLANAVTAMASVVLPGAVWIEKAGSFENARTNILFNIMYGCRPLRLIGSISGGAAMIGFN